MTKKNLTFSIIVPTYNEEQDIENTLQALKNLDYSWYEVIVVDDASRDNTVQKVKKFINGLNDFTLLQQPKNKGVATARNIGIKKASGEVLVILNADVLLLPNFLNQIAPYYKQGYQWVGVRSKVKNKNTSFPRFAEAEYYYVHYIKPRHQVWSEGFSCTRKAAFGVGLFPESMPGCSGEDVDFGYDLEKKYKGIRITDVVAPHIVPDTLKEFWNQNKGRGKGRTNYYYYMKSFSIPKLIVNSFFSTLWRLFKIVALFPVVNSWKISKYTPKGRGDFLPFIWAGYVKQTAMIVGMWVALRNVISGLKLKTNTN